MEDNVEIRLLFNEGDPLFIGPYSDALVIINGDTIQAYGGELSNGYERALGFIDGYYNCLEEEVPEVLVANCIVPF